MLGGQVIAAKLKDKNLKKLVACCQQQTTPQADSRRFFGRKSYPDIHWDDGYSSSEVYR